MSVAVCLVCMLFSPGMVCEHRPRRNVKSKSVNSNNNGND